jgi:hypothetical protein
MKECLRGISFCLLVMLTGIAYDVEAHDSRQMPMNACKCLQNAYDSKGSYQGRIDRHGRVYDRKGMYQGKVTPKGDVYDRKGRPNETQWRMK